jgi:hypothetical protein
VVTGALLKATTKIEYLREQTAEENIRTYEKEKFMTVENIAYRGVT